MIFNSVCPRGLGGETGGVAPRGILARNKGAKCALGGASCPGGKWQGGSCCVGVAVGRVHRRRHRQRYRQRVAVAAAAVQEEAAARRVMGPANSLLLGFVFRFRGRETFQRGNVGGRQGGECHEAQHGSFFFAS